MQTRTVLLYYYCIQSLVEWQVLTPYTLRGTEDVGGVPSLYMCLSCLLYVTVCCDTKHIHASWGTLHFPFRRESLSICLVIYAPTQTKRPFLFRADSTPLS
jgi:hypothetical protein